MEKQNGTIIVVECISSSVNYIKDILDEGYEPVLLELGCSEEDYPAYRINHDLALKSLYTDEHPGLPAPRIVQAGKDYNETLEIVRELSPVLIVPGGDEGIETAMKLSTDLGLVTNNLENFGTMRNKYLAQEALRAAGIRCIKSKIVQSHAQADAFFQELGGRQAVLKPVSGGASVGVHICKNPQEYKTWINAYSDEELSHNGVLMQECITGTEYICNTVSCQGHHKVTSLLRYKKVLVDGYCKRYETVEKLDWTCDTAGQLMEYAFKVLDAIGIKYGPVHSEIMIDENGPVLIEANCRLCGGVMKAAWLDRVFGNHESNISLCSYLHQEEFLADPRTVLAGGNEYGVIKFLALERNMFVKKSLVAEAFQDIPCVMYSVSMGDNRMYERTVDMSTTGGIIFLADKDPGVVKQALEKIDDLQANHPDRIYECQ